MIKYLTKNICDITNGIIAHGVNCQGVMGAGVALAIRNKWPGCYDLYKSTCDEAQDKSTLLGSCLFFWTQSDEEHLIANCFTQLNYGPQRSTPYADAYSVYTSMFQVCEAAKQAELPVYTVKIGCLRGGLNWETDVLPIFSQLSDSFNLDITVCDI